MFQTLDKAFKAANLFMDKVDMRLEEYCEKTEREIREAKRFKQLKAEAEELGIDISALEP